MPHSKGPFSNPYPEPINTIPRIDTYFFKIHPNILLPSMLRSCYKYFPVDLLVKILKALLFSSFLTTCHAHLNLVDLITLTKLGKQCKL